MAKKDIHPEYYPEAEVICACGNTFITGSTQPKIKVEICYNCHPFFTGKEVLIDTEGRVEKFQKKQKAAEERYAKVEAKRKKTEEKGEEKEPRRPLTLRELLEQD